MVLALALGALAFSSSELCDKEKKAVAKLEDKAAILCSDLKRVADVTSAVVPSMKKAIEAAIADNDAAKEGYSTLAKLFKSHAEGAMDPTAGIPLKDLMSASWAVKSTAVKAGLDAYLATEDCFEFDEEGCTELFDEEIDTIFMAIDKVAPLMKKYGLDVLPNDEMAAQFAKLLATTDEEMETRVREEDQLAAVMLTRVRVAMRDECA